MTSNQAGQVLPLGLVLLALCVLLGLVVFNTGQVASDKMTLANAADAAAYSGSLVQARTLNFQSYTNRAMVANQVSMAQAVSLQSWVSYGAIAAENAATVLSAVPILNGLASGLQAGVSAAASVMTPLAQALLITVDKTNAGLSAAQQIMYTTTFKATPDIVKAVVQETDSRFTVNTAFNAYALPQNLSRWQQFTQSFNHRDTEQMEARAHLIEQSRDNFSRARYWTLFKNFWFYTTPITRHRLYREGETRLVKSEGADGVQWEWKAKDTLSLHNQVWRPFRGQKGFELPIGWAEAFANSQQLSHTLESGACTTPADIVGDNHCSRFLAMNELAELNAANGLRSLGAGSASRTAMSGYSGIQAFRSLSESVIANEASTLQLKVEVALPTDAVRSQGSLAPTRTFEAAPRAPGQAISSISVAEVFYQRPDVHENPQWAAEQANGYNPYWGARLASVSPADRALGLSLRVSRAGNAQSDNATVDAGALRPYREPERHVRDHSTVRDASGEAELSSSGVNHPLTEGVR